MFNSRADYERVIKLLLRELASDATAAYDLDRDADGNPRFSWTDRELAEADRYRLDVTERPGGWGHPTGGWPGGRPPANVPVPPAELELRLRVDDGWAPGYADDVLDEPTQEGS